MSVSLPEVMRQISTLPPERVEEVYDFVLFLKTRLTGVVEDSDAWSDEDQRDAIRAGLHYAESLLAAEEEHDV